MAPEIPGNIIAEIAKAEQKNRYVRVGSTSKLVNCVKLIDTNNDINK